MKPFCVIYIGVAIMPNHVAGDKNFLCDLAEFLNRNHVASHFVSISELPVQGYEPQGNFAFIPRPLHVNNQKHYYRDSMGRIIGYHHHHKSFKEFMELCSVLLLAAPKLRKIMGLYPNVIIHWKDLSLMMPLVRLIGGKRARYVLSLMHYVPRGNLGNLLRGRAARSADCIITATRKAQEFLARDGCSPSRIVVAPWGSKGILNEGPPLKQFKPNDEKTRLLWAGFLQQIGEQDFFKTVGMARKMMEVRSDIEFTFNFKPEFFKERYLSFQCKGVYIKAGGASFLKELSAYDGLLSPILRTDTTLSPTLTWIEALSAGLPIITTRALGIDELLIDGRSALVFDNYEGVATWLTQERDLRGKLRSMRSSAQEEFKKRYTIDIVGARYLDIYRKLVDS